MEEWSIKTRRRACIQPIESYQSRLLSECNFVYSCPSTSSPVYFLKADCVMRRSGGVKNEWRWENSGINLGLTASLN